MARRLPSQVAFPQPWFVDLVGLFIADHLQVFYVVPVSGSSRVRFHFNQSIDGNDPDFKRIADFGDERLFILAVEIKRIGNKNIDGGSGQLIGVQGKHLHVFFFYPGLADLLLRKILFGNGNNRSVAQLFQSFDCRNCISGVQLYDQVEICRCPLVP